MKTTIESTEEAGKKLRIEQQKRESVAFILSCLHRPETRKTLLSTNKKGSGNTISNASGTLEFSYYPENRIVIRDKQQKDFHVDLQVIQKKGQTFLVISTERKFENNESLHIFPTLFIQTIFKYIQAIYTIEYIKGFWLDYSVNYQTFLECIGKIPMWKVYKQHNRPRYQKQYLAAAKETWSGKLARKLGYSKPTSLVIKKRHRFYEIFVHFEK